MGMSSKERFKGVVVRIEPDGFGIVRFEKPLGANTHGVFSATTSSSLPSLRRLRPGVLVIGTAEANSKDDLAAVDTLDLAAAS
jgi:hypothetical protein